MAATILSEKAKNIISLFEENMRTDIFSNHRIYLAVSLYANIINKSGDKERAKKHFAARNAIFNWEK